jgi:hypothetical protein
MKTLPVIEVRTDWPTARGGRIDKGWVRVLANAGELDPIIVSRREHQLIDGRHRLAAAIARGEEFIEIVELDVQGELEALEQSARTNAHCGLPLTTADRRALVREILQRAPEWSDRRIATVAGVSPTTAGAVRRRLRDEGGVQTGQFRVGRDSKTRAYVPKDANSEESPAVSGPAMEKETDPEMPAAAGKPATAPARSFRARWLVRLRGLVSSIVGLVHRRLPTRLTSRHDVRRIWRRQGRGKSRYYPAPGKGLAQSAVSDTGCGTH